MKNYPTHARPDTERADSMGVVCHLQVLWHKAKIEELKGNPYLPVGDDYSRPVLL